MVARQELKVNRTLDELDSIYGRISPIIERASGKAALFRESPPKDYGGCAAEGWHGHFSHAMTI